MEELIDIPDNPNLAETLNFFIKKAKEYGWSQKDINEVVEHATKGNCKELITNPNKRNTNN